MIQSYVLHCTFCLFFFFFFIEYTNCQDSQNFTYSESDNIVILPNSSIAIYGSLTTIADEYLSSSGINVTTQISQIGDSEESFAVFNMYYFNLTSDQGMQCYQNWVLGNLIIVQSPCPEIAKLFQQACHNYSNCYNQDITYSLALNQWQYVQHMLYIHNIHPKLELNLKTRISIQLISSNAWFFWAVGLTCLLMIMIVVLTGVVFNLNLKMKRTKKLYEQYRLTVQNQIDFVSNLSDQNKED